MHVGQMPVGGATISGPHHGLLENNYNQGLQGLFLTVILGLYFTALEL